jgi:hypothetical protein
MVMIMATGWILIPEPPTEERMIGIITWNDRPYKKGSKDRSGILSWPYIPIDSFQDSSRKATRELYALST